MACGSSVRTSTGKNTYDRSRQRSESFGKRINSEDRTGNVRLASGLRKERAKITRENATLHNELKSRSRAKVVCEITA